nr:acyltransferase [Mobilicoccus caccae]
MYHAFRLSGTPIPGTPLEQGLENIWVDGFFVVSGYLIVSSWMRRPRATDFLRNRLLRLYPAFFVCLLVTAFVFAPLGAALSGIEVGLGQQARYVLVNLGLYMREYDIGGTPSGVPWPEAWNGSLWTLFWEFLCYLGVLTLGVVGLLRRRWAIPLVFLGAWSLQLLVEVTPIGDARVPLGLYRIGSLGIDDMARFAVTFSAGALVYHGRNHLPCAWRWVVAAAVGVLLSLWLPEYRLVGALLLAYALIAAGALMRRPWMTLRTDVSYGVYIYAFPVQQLLAIVGVHGFGVPAYAVASLMLTVVLAYVSWRLVERPALGYKAR